MGLSIKSYDKALRLPAHNPRHVATTTNIQQRTKKTDWRNHTREEWKKIFKGKPEKIPGLLKPWTTATNIEYHILPGRKNTTEENKEQALNMLDEDRNNVKIYTDGSAADGTHNGGGGIVITNGNARNPQVLNSISLPAGL